MRLQSSARNSMEWFENLSRYEHLDAEQFAYALLTRSQRVSHENLRLRDPVYLAELETWFARRATGRATAEGRPPMFTPFQLRELELANRVVVSPMSMYSSVEGMPGDFHLVHYGSRAQGGAGLVVTEMTDVERDGRITPGCAGIWNDEQAAAWKRIVDYVHDRTPAKLALQLGHAGPKGATKLEWEGANEPLEEGGWPLLAASAIPWTPANQVPRAMTRADMDRVTEAYRRGDGTRRVGGLRHGRAAFRPRLPALELHHAAHEPPHRRVRRQPREPPALPARGLRRRAGRVPVRPSDLRAHLGDRLGRLRGRHG